MPLSLLTPRQNQNMRVAMRHLPSGLRFLWVGHGQG